MPMTMPGTMIATYVSSSNSARRRGRRRSMASADAVPMSVASTAVIAAMVRLVRSAVMRNRSDQADAYHWVENPVRSVTWRPALKL